MERKYETGTHVIFFDQKGAPRDALATVFWGAPTSAQMAEAKTGKPAQVTEPAINLVFVEGSAARDDSHGRQIGRDASVVHRSNQYAPGNFWCWPDELTDADRARLNADE